MHAEFQKSCRQYSWIGNKIKRSINQIIKLLKAKWEKSICSGDYWLSFKTKDMVVAKRLIKIINNRLIK